MNTKPITLEERGCIVAALALQCAAHAGAPGKKTFVESTRLGVRLCDGSEAQFASFVAKQRRNLVTVSVEIAKETINEVLGKRPQG